jgi:CxxC-x17-CxxC domain-containing protein
MLNCIACGREFIFSTRDQEYYTAQGYANQPKRCRECRALLKRSKITVDSDQGAKDYFPATCDNCGRPAYVPFKPTGSKPVLCRDCFVAKKIDDAAHGNEPPAPDAPPTYDAK